MSAGCFALPMPVMAQHTKTITPVKMHTVGPKESLSSIGRLYEVNGRVLANYNNIDYDKGLTIGQVLKIPPRGTTMEQVSEPVITEDLKIQSPPPAAETKNEAGTPIYHKVEKKETLYHISTLYNKVPIENLKKWNNLTGDALNEGMNLIVGYKNAATEAKKAPEVKTEIEKPVLVQEAKKEDPRPVKETQAAEPVSAGGDMKGGAFRSLYDKQSSGEPVNQEGMAGTFKSTSGWADGKYYCLFNTATPGTIIKVTNDANGKFIYAKVLDAMPDIKQNNGLLVCISNAAAKELGAEETNFKCSINYSK